MRRGPKIALISVGVALGLGLGWGGYLLVRAGELTSLEYHSDAECRRVEGVVGSEDMAFTAASGTRAGGVFVSSDDRRATIDGEPVRGAIHYYSLAADAPPVYDATDGEPALFHPHGIGPTPPSSKPERLFVVNHARESSFGVTDTSPGPGQTIEVFDVVKRGGQVMLDHQQTIDDPLLLNPNDVAAVDGERFYVTNDHTATTKLGRKLEEFGRLARGHVLYWDGEGFAIVAEGIHYANGVELSPDGATVYVTSVTNAYLHVFDRDLDTGALTPRGGLSLRGPDNITIAKDGSLWIGAHPKLLTFSRYAFDITVRSPSQVFHVTPTSAGGWEIEDVFLSDGSDISGSSVALARGEDRFLIGSVFDAWLLDCTRSGSPL